MRSKILSALTLSGLLVGLAAAQTPQAPAAKGASGAKKSDAKPSDLTAEVLRNHPDIRLAEAKVRMAEAELAQTKLLVAQRIAIAEAKVKEYTARAEYATKMHTTMQPFAGATRAEMMLIEKDAVTAKAALIGAEAELAAARGTVSGINTTGSGDTALIQFLKQGESDPAVLLGLLNSYYSKQVPTGSAATDKLRELTEKRVSVTMKRVPFDEGMADFIKQAGITGITFRVPDWASAKLLKNPPMVGPLQGEQTVVGWLQLILDHFNESLSDVPPGHGGKYDIYVREYGLLMTKVDLAPTGAMTLSEYVRQIRNSKAFQESVEKK